MLMATTSWLHSFTVCPAPAREVVMVVPMAAK